MVSRSIVITICALLSLAVVGCSSASTEDVPLLSSPDTSLPSEAGIDDEQEPLAPVDVGASLEEVEAEEDFVPVSRDEYIEALDFAVDCIKDRGFSAGWVDQPAGMAALTVNQGGGLGDDTTAMDQAVDECSEEHLNSVQDRYLTTIRGTDAERDQAFLACLVEAGAIENTDMSADEASEAALDLLESSEGDAHGSTMVCLAER